MTSLTIRRHKLHRRVVGVPTGGPAPEVVSESLRAALEQMDLSGDGLWLIRRLDVRIALAVDSGGRGGGRILAAATARAIMRVVAAGPQPPDVLCFPDRAGYVAQWVVDVVRGRAEGRWEYRGFPEGTPSMALRDFAATQPANLLDALLTLPPSQVDEIVEALEPPDAATVTHLLTPGARRGADVRAIAVTVHALVRDRRLPADLRRATLVVVLEHIRHGGISDAVTAARARDLAVVVLETSSLPTVRCRRAIRALADGRWREAAHAGAVEAAMALAGWDTDERTAAIELLLEPAAEAYSERPAAHLSQFGGLYLLLPLLDELPLREATLGWREAVGVPAHRVMAAVAVISVLGPERAAAIWADFGLRLALGLGDLQLDELPRWARWVSASQCSDYTSALGSTLARRAPVAAADTADRRLLPTTLFGIRPTRVARLARLAACALLRELSYRLPGMAAADVGHLRRNVLAFDASLVVDGEDEEPILVQLGYPPLGLLLTLTGMDRRQFMMEATGGRPWMLTRPG